MMDFNTMVAKSKVGVRILCRHHTAVAWSELGDHGNPCVDWYRFETEEERIQDALMLAATKVALPKGSDTHIKLSKLVASDLQAYFVTYDWLVKAVSRLLGGGGELTELSGNLRLCEKIKSNMKAQGISQLNTANIKKVLQ